MGVPKGVALVTGAGRRIGAAIAIALSEQGMRVAVHYRSSQSEAVKVVRKIERRGGVACAIQGDITQVADCERIVNETIRTFGRLDLLVNNAAVFFKTPLATVTEAQWDHTVNTNLKGSFFCARAAAKVMRKGQIINIADWSGLRPYRDYLPYCISKAGVIALTKGLARTLAPHIAVNAIAPGPVLLPKDFNEEEKTEIVRHTPLRRLGSPSDVVEAVRFLAEGTSFMTGAVIIIDGGRLVS